MDTSVISSHSQMKGVAYCMQNLLLQLYSNSNFLTSNHEMLS